MTILQLKDHFKENPWIVNQIMHFGSRMRSTKSYWNSRCSELLDMVNQIGAPTVFFTLSSADYHWPDLYRLLGHDVSTLSVKEKASLSKFFLENSFTNHFDVKDMWFRYEYQHRGSIHLHGLAWLNNAPKVRENMSDNEKKAVLSYFDNLVSCNNPDIHILPLSQHPCQISLDQVTNLNSDLSHLLNQVQRHTKCSKSHCLRNSGKDKKLQCRYKFPKPLMAESDFEMKDNEIVDINFKRNDVFMNKYNPWLIQTWRANIDFSPVLSKRIVYRYIAKYASKSEVKSICYNKVLTDIQDKSCDESESVKKAIRRLLISTCAERDYCSQEVMHYLMGYHFYHSSRDFVVVNLKNLDWTSVSYNGKQKNIFDMYASRPKTFEKFLLFEFAKFLFVSKTNVFMRSRHAVFRCFPRTEYTTCFDDLLRLVTQLFFPWRSIGYSARALSGTEYPIDDISYVDHHMKDYSMSLYQKYMRTSNLEELSDDDDELSENDVRRSSESDIVTLLSNYNPNKSHLTSRLIQSNRNINWDYLSNRITSRDTIHIICGLLQTECKALKDDVVDISLLNKDQHMVFKHIITLTDKISQGKHHKFEFLIVQGMAGTGKTYLLKCYAQYIVSKLGSKALKLVAPTGVAAKIINGTTLHSFLSLGRFSSNAECHRFANKNYVNLLRKVCSGRCTKVELNLLAKRHLNFMTSTKKKFINSLCVCSTSEATNEYNLKKLKELNKPVAVIRAQNNNKTAFSCSDDLADGLTNVLEVSRGSKVMLRRNLNVSRGLVNGAIGVVKHIFYEKGEKPPSLPVCLLIIFENVDLSDLSINYVPIMPLLAHWYKNGISCSRYQLPISLCWACTIYKSQGIGLQSMLLDAGPSEFALGLLYVALSRVPDISSLCLVTSLSLGRLNSCKSSNRFKMRRKFLKNLKEIFSKIFE
ncbi:LOW QUALITY PROTEIN: ATP-dependent DNA helicase [Frankliniella fusca]|uniref:ATP-dependent DNA helicase n=1 Tax=Frankliniella fusca TaxID=407009 RepID=A0AAE1GYP4_9NEOP|nr:LOW QUALITY PROTEIN: ATP-dependent DNA helicase [Frankliniella fusca]